MRATKSIKLKARQDAVDSILIFGERWNLQKPDDSTAPPWRFEILSPGVNGGDDSAEDRQTNGP